MLTQAIVLLLVLAGLLSLATTFGMLRFRDPLLRLQTRARLGTLAVTLAVIGAVLDVRYGSGNLVLAPLLAPVLVAILTPRVLGAIAALRLREEEDDRDRDA